MQILPVLCRTDNYAYILYREGARDCVVVDPSESEPVAQVLLDLNLLPTALWITHHHYDHVGGIEGLLENNSGIEVVAHAVDAEKINKVSRTLAQGEELLGPGGSRVEIIENPGHTSGAISFYMPEAKAVFTGDTLFTAGCGRIFEGTASQMRKSLDSLASLPTDTRVFAGHEYTEANLRFAKSVEPDNLDIAARIESVKTTRYERKHTMGTTIGLERLTNPFLRCETDVVSQTISEKFGVNGDADQVFAQLRTWKDSF